MTTSMVRRAGLALLFVYMTSIVAANWLTTRYGQVPVAPGLVATAGTFAIGGAVMTRDFLQDALGRAAVFAAILTGAGLSYLLSSHRIALASGITFLIAESAEFGIYTPMRRRVRWGSWLWSGVISLANLTGIVADTLLFLWLAGFALTVSGVAGQFAGKAYVTVAVIACAGVIRRALSHSAVNSASA